MQRNFSSLFHLHRLPSLLSARVPPPARTTFLRPARLMSQSPLAEHPAKRQKMNTDNSSRKV